MTSRTMVHLFLCSFLSWVVPPGAHALETEETIHFECATIHPDSLNKLMLEAAQRGEIQDLSGKFAPPVKLFPASHDSLTPKSPVEPSDFFLFEDSSGLLLTNFSDNQLFNLMTAAANKLLARDGDQWDFISFFVNFTPHHTVGAAFYLPIKNDIFGLGQSVFDNHAFRGLSGTKVQGYVMMWNIASWDATGSDLADFTQLVFGQEFEHRFGMFLPPTDNGLQLQGDNASCGRGGHWNFKVDAQGSGMEAAEWVGSSPSVIDTVVAPAIGGNTIWFNTDIPGGVWSLPDLYLMGFVTPQEMDSLASELRYMTTSCASPYNAGIDTFASINMTNTAGNRTPGAATAQHSFRTAWIVIHQPGAPPSNGQLQRAADLLTEWTDVWHYSSLNRGLHDNHIAPPFVITCVLPDTVLPSLDTLGFDISVLDSAGSHDASSGLLHYSIGGGTYVTSSLVDLGGGDYHATLPASPCEEVVKFYVSFESSDGGTTINEPVGAPTSPFSAVVLRTDSVVFSDDFETDMGWTVGAVGDNATSGIWTRVDPIGTGAQPEDDNSTGAGTLCFVTGQGSLPPGDALGENDVDGGRTTLSSPVFDLNGKNGVIRYYRWYSNNSGAGPNSDSMEISVSNDGGNTWVKMEAVKENQIDWVKKEFVVSNFVQPTDSVRVRFVASDLGAGSLVEAGVDDFEVIVTEVSALAGDANASGSHTLADIIAAVNYLFNKPGFPVCGSADKSCWLTELLCRGDWDGSGTVTLSDVIRGVNKLFNKPGGPWDAVPVGSCCLSTP